jgi:hypothetical protein
MLLIVSRLVFQSIDRVIAVTTRWKDSDLDRVSTFYFSTPPSYLRLYFDEMYT